MTLPVNQSPLTSNNLEPPSRTWPPFVPSASAASSRPRRHAIILTRQIQSRPSLEEPPNGCYTYGVNISPVPLLKAFGSRIIDPPKNAEASSSPNMNLPTKQRAPRSQKRAGTEANPASLSRCSRRQRSKSKFYSLQEKTYWGSTKEDF